MQIAYATRYRCDVCGTEAGSAAVPDAMMGEQSPPDGWVVGLRFEYYVGALVSYVRDLCSSCSLKPVGELTAMLKAKAQ